jgi:hypothetical protein
MAVKYLLACARTSGGKMPCALSSSSNCIVREAKCQSSTTSAIKHDCDDDCAPSRLVSGMFTRMHGV